MIITSAAARKSKVTCPRMGLALEWGKSFLYQAFELF